MYLKKIEMQGFKSFANKTEIEFGKDITAIVGPNGSGKSNISDAIRWVLGEQSAKNLRGSKMEDVIFSGTNKRRALGFAEVSMYFDNKDRHIPVDYNEVAITRRMFRSGESEFYINRNSCRLKDIRQLFMDTGIGKDGYSIIGQGRIDEILSDRPEDRRSIFEEAAGIVKYKKKKEDTEKKLLGTKDNLVRIKDLLSEVSRQEQGLAVEANKARKFTALYDELKILEANLYIKEVEDIGKKINQVNKGIEDDQEVMREEEESKKILESQIKDIQGKISKIRDKIQDGQHKRERLVDNIRKNQNKINLLEEREKYNKKDIVRIKEDISSIFESKKILDREINQLKLKKTSLQEEYKEIEEDFKGQENKLSTISKDIRDREKNIEIEKDKLMKIYNKISYKDNEINNLENLNRNINERLKELKKELEMLKDEEKAKKKYLEELLPKEENLRKEINSLINKKNQFVLEEEKYEKLINHTLEKLKSKEIRLQGNISNYKIYKNMEEYYEGYYQGVKNFLNSIERSQITNKGYVGLVVDLLQVDKLYEKAIEVSLGSRLQNIVTEREKDAKDIIEFLKNNNKGRVTILPLDIIRGNPINLNLNSFKRYGVLGLGHELVDFNTSYKSLFQYLLGRTIIVDNLDNGIKLANKLNHRYRIVTLDGDILNPGGSLTGGSYNDKFNLISRKNKIIELEEKIKNNKEAINNLKDKRRLNVDKYQKNNEMKIAIDKKIKDKELISMKLNNKKENLIEEQSRLKKDIRKKREEIKLLEKDVEENKKRKASYNKKIEEFKNYSIKLEKSIQNLNDKLSDCKKEEDIVSNKVTELKIELNNYKNKVNNIEDNISNKIEDMKANTKSLNKKEDKLKSIKKDIDQLYHNKKEREEEISREKEEEIILSQEIGAKNKEKEDLKDLLIARKEKIGEINKILIMTEKNKNKRELDLSRHKLELDNKNRRLAEDYELDYESAVQLKDKSIDIGSKLPRIDKLKSSIRKLGNVNLASLEDYKVVKERLDFLDEQYNDLIDSKEDLNRLIKDMEKEMKKKFYQSFKAVNKNFKKIFSVFFNGGKASLKLKDKDDILNTGIEIRVQPPGKKLQNINLLSGGEKSLTAVALLFSILELKPAPFCILDEIDASLDEANISRYTNYLKKINDRTQFILITHQKTTMEIANILYGVTMAEKGISRLLSVKLEDYIDELVS